MIRRWITQPNALLPGGSFVRGRHGPDAGGGLPQRASAPRGAPEKRQSPVELGGLLQPLVGGLQIFGFNLIFACVLVGPTSSPGDRRGSPDPLRLLLSPPAVPALWADGGHLVLPNGRRSAPSRPGCCACSISARPPAWWRCPPSAASPRERRTSPSSRPWGAGPPPDGCGISACPVRMGWSLLWASCSCSPPP